MSPMRITFIAEVELVGRAEAYAYEHEEHWHDGPDWQELFNKKFAELIIQECAEICLEANDHKNILRHFGIKP